MLFFPEDIWMLILQIGDEDAFSADRIPGYQNESTHLRSWSNKPGNSTPSSATRLKPVSATFSAVCTQWRKAILATSTCWVTTVNSPIKSPISEVVLQTSLQCHQASDIDIYIHDTADLLDPAQYVLLYSRMRGILRLLLGYSSRWRSFMVVNLEHSEIPTLLSELNGVVIWRHLIAMEIVSRNPWDSPIPEMSLIASPFPSLLRMHIDSDCISLGPKVHFPNITHLSMDIIGVAANDLLHSISNTSGSAIKVLRVGTNVAQAENNPAVITGPVLGGPNVTFQFLTDLTIHILVQDLLPFFRRGKPPALRSLCVETGSTGDDRSPALLEVLDGKPITLPSLLVFEICGQAIVEDDMIVISQLSMPALWSLVVQSENFVPLSSLRNWTSLPHIKLPDLQALSLERPIAQAHLMAVLDVPNLSTLILTADPDFSDLNTGLADRTPATSFPTLKTLETCHYGLQTVGDFLQCHDFPSLISMKLSLVWPPIESSMWDHFLESHQMLVGQLDELEVDLFEVEEGEGILFKHAPFLRRRLVGSGRNTWRRF